MVRRHLAESRERAQKSIDDHRVLVGGSVATKAARLVDPGEAIELVGDGPRFVSRGGEKLDAALVRFGLDVRGKRVFDAGASTGGFTDCVLQRGAHSVVAVDVGFGQIHERLRADARVEVHERVNLRTVDVQTRFGGRRFDVVVGDLSFISLTSVASVLLEVVDPAGALVLLVKPQFEAGRAVVSKGRGIVRTPDVWLGALERVVGSFALRGAAMMGCMVSPIRGADGNVEFLAYLRPNMCAINVRDSIDENTRALLVEAVAAAERARSVRES